MEPFAIIAAVVVTLFGVILWFRSEVRVPWSPPPHHINTQVYRRLEQARSELFRRGPAVRFTVFERVDELLIPVARLGWGKPAARASRFRVTEGLVGKAASATKNEIFVALSPAQPEVPARIAARVSCEDVDAVLCIDVKDDSLILNDEKWLSSLGDQVRKLAAELAALLSEPVHRPTFAIEPAEAPDNAPPGSAVTRILMTSNGERQVRSPSSANGARDGKSAEDLVLETTNPQRP